MARLFTLIFSAWRGHITQLLSWLAPFLSDHLISERRNNIWILPESNLGELAPQAYALSITPWPLGQHTIASNLLGSVPLTWGAAQSAAARRPATTRGSGGGSRRSAAARCRRPASARTRTARCEAPLWSSRRSRASEKSGRVSNLGLYDDLTYELMMNVIETVF